MEQALDASASRKSACRSAVGKADTNWIPLQSGLVHHRDVGVREAKLEENRAVRARGHYGGQGERVRRDGRCFAFV